MASLHFGNDNTRDKYKEFLDEYLEYKTDPTNIRKAKQISLTAWHLVDWAQDESAISDIGEFRASLYPSCPSLKVMHDLANASKHRVLNRPKAFILETNKHEGEFSREFSPEFNIDYLKIKLVNGNTLDFEDEIEKVKLFWDDYFSNSNNLLQ